MSIANLNIIYELVGEMGPGMDHLLVIPCYILVTKWRGLRPVFIIVCLLAKLSALESHRVTRGLMSHICSRSSGSS